MMMKIKSLGSLLLTAAMALTAGSALAATPTVTVALDSAYIVMGQVTPLHITVVQDANSPVRMVDIPEQIMPGVEKHSEGKADTTDIGSGRYEIKRDIVIQSFDSGLYMLPPVKLVAGNETIASNQVALKVLPVNVDTMKTVHDYAPISTVDRHFIDYLPTWMLDYGIWILLTLIVIAGGVWAWMKYGRRSARAARPAKVEPPYEVAMRELNALGSEHLCQEGREKEFYTRLTDILRIYLRNRFGINAMEMTSSEIIDAVRKNSLADPSRDYMEQVLRMADFVKFAKMRPLPTDNAASMDSAIRFVESTKPVPQDEPAAGTGDKTESSTAKA